MRIARFVHSTDQSDGTPSYAFVEKDKSDGKDYLVEFDGYLFSSQQVRLTGKRYPIDGEGIRLLSPVLPSKVYGIMKNYRQPGDTSTPAADEMIVFSKPSTAVCGPDDPIVMPTWAQSLHFEAEVAVVIGRMTRNVSEKNALSHVLGYTCVNDVTAYGIHGADPFAVRAKGFDTACPLGPWIQTDCDPTNAHMHMIINGTEQEKASGTTAQLLHPIAQQISFISSFATLLPGDVILTGCADPTGELHDRDEAVVKVDEIGSLRNVVLKPQSDED
jgi:2-keto-4-pentenoate hydratase/2-oxohepta-3-ene-1,7-dioic acid hydratase in catechol pathway